MDPERSSLSAHHEYLLQYATLIASLDSAHISISPGHRAFGEHLERDTLIKAVWLSQIALSLPILGLGALLATASAGCGHSTSAPPPDQQPADQQPADQQPSTAVTEDTADVSRPAPSSPDAPTPATEYQPRWRGDYCQSDSECDWNHTCFPRRCVSANTVIESPCDKTTAPPGTCACVENMCTLRPDAGYLRQLAYEAKAEAKADDPRCATDPDCAIDIGSATCHVGGDARIGPMRREGPTCTCELSSGQCQYSWSEPVACKSWRDCSWVKEPRLRPVSAKQVQRPIKRKVRPCRDSEIDSKCGTDGVCQVVRWKC